MGGSHFAVLQYDGTDFAGWQRQPDQRTVQAEIESALHRLAGVPTPCTAAGRTDAGVHARGQVISFELSRRWDRQDLTRALRALTPPDIWIVRSGPAPDGFHARRDAAARRYQYVIGTDAAAASPFRFRYEWYVPHPLDPDALDAAAAHTLGEHDFRAFAAVGQEKPHYRCQITRATWATRPNGQGFIFTVEADRFLHHMVRFLVGTMTEVARARRPLDEFIDLLTSIDNQATSPPAPPHGLFLEHVSYPQLDEAPDL
jgi:tRNA pseudouridine38-40 synthase